MSLVVKRGRPLLRDGHVQRPRLLTRLIEGQAAPLVEIVAPAGYGKTGLLAEWAAQDERANVWLALEPWHNDPIQLIRDIAFGLGESESLETCPGELLDQSSSELAAMLAALATVLEGRLQPVVLILDDVHLLTDADSQHALTVIAEHLSPGSQLVLASRTQTALPVGRLRAHRALLELDSSELAMDLSEATSLLNAADLQVDSPEVLETLLMHTEGWPVGLYLAALSAHEAPDPMAALASFGGEDHIVGDYLKDEFFCELNDDDVNFLIDSSPLERLSGALCDAVLDREGSVGILDRLAQSGLPFGPIDRNHKWFRCHRLLRDMLLSELRKKRPEREAQLHLNASAWYDKHGELDSSIAHAVASRHAGRAGDLLWSNLPRYVTDGRNELIQNWLKHFSSDDLSNHPSLALTAAYSSLALGDLPRADHWGLVGAAALARATAPSRAASLPTGVAVIKATIDRRGVAPMGRQAARAYQLEDDDSPWRSICCLLQGVADHLLGNRAQAREHLEDGIHRSSVIAPPVEMLCLSQLAMITVEEGDWDRGLDLITCAIRQSERHRLTAYPAAALTFAVSADLRSHAGYVDEGRRDARKAAHLLARLGDFIPWYEAETRIMLARAALQLADVRAARTLLAQASRSARRVPDAVMFGGWLDETWGMLDSAATNALTGPATLTIAELRILRFLPTHLSLREIGARLHVSTNTVKTQTHAVYRKLDVSSRSQAVARAAQIGLLDS